MTRCDVTYLIKTGLLNPVTLWHRDLLVLQTVAITTTTIAAAAAAAMGRDGKSGRGQQPLVPIHITELHFPGAHYRGGRGHEANRFRFG